MIVEEYDEKEFFDKSIKMLEKDYGNSFANDFKDIYIKQQKEIERLNNDIKYWEEKYSHTKFDENRYKDRCEKLLEKLNFYENTEWGIRSCEILKIFKNILKGEDKE